MADLLSISAGSLDDPSWYRPQADIWAASAQPADYMNPAIPKFAHQPTPEETQELLSSQS